MFTALIFNKRDCNHEALERCNDCPRDLRLVLHLSTLVFETAEANSDSSEFCRG
jgi:hypothetical protein